MTDFDLILLTEDLDRSLAVLSVLFCIDIEDLLYVQVNQRNDFYAKDRFLDFSIPVWCRSGITRYRISPISIWYRCHFENQTKPTMSPTTLKHLYGLNWPDFLLHEISKIVLEMRINQINKNHGAGHIENLAHEIRKKSEQLSDECLDNSFVVTEGQPRNIVHVKEFDSKL